MTEFWLDANFFIPAEAFPHYLTTFKDILGFIGRRKEEYSLKITKRVSNEVRSFSNLIHVFCKTITVENSQEFSKYCEETKFATGYSKKRHEPADNSLAFAASHSTNDAYIVTNDEGFLKIKRRKPYLLKNVEIIEPTDFLKKIMLDVEDADFKDRIKSLIIHYSEHFITFLVNDKRSISRILESLLVVSTITTFVSISRNAENPVEKKQLRKDMYALEKFISNQTLTLEERDRLKPVIDLFEPFAAYYKTFEINREDFKIHNNLTGYLYLKYPELLLTLRQRIEMKTEDESNILNRNEALETFMRKKMFGIRIKETIRYFKDCSFEKAFFHFKPVLESDWEVDLSPEKKSILKFLYGIFLLNVNDLGFFEYLLSNKFWDEFEHITQIFKTLFSIVKGIVGDDIHQLSDSNIQLFYNLGLYYANSGSPFGLNIFNALFQLDLQRLENLDWCEDFFKRYLLELRINQKEITESMKNKLLKFLAPASLDDNTNSRFDRTNELSDFTPIEKAPDLYKQLLYFINMNEQDDFIEAYCWNDMIRSIILLRIPRKFCPHLENVRTLQIKMGDLKTKKIAPMDKKKKRARIMVELNEKFQLDLKRFEIAIKNI